MNIVVFIKQVPDTDNVKWTENNNIDRANTDCIINPLDKQAIEAALNIKKINNAHTTAVTMGPINAKCILKEAIALGMDEAAILCDSKFAGSDTCSTSKVLSGIIKEKYPDTDLILFGQSAIDGETSQTGPATAVRLNMPFITHVKEINISDNDTLVVNQETDGYKTTYRVEMPAVLCINNYAIQPHIPSISGYMKAQDYEIKSYNFYDLNLSETDTGIKGSPTSVVKVFRNEMHRNCKMLDEEKDKNYPDFIFNEIKKVMEN